MRTKTSRRDAVGGFRVAVGVAWAGRPSNAAQHATLNKSDRAPLKTGLLTTLRAWLIPL